MMNRQFLTILLFALTFFGSDAPAGASGLGKFVGGSSRTTTKPCANPSHEAPRGFASRTRFSALAGSTRTSAYDSAFSLYGDLGYRVVSAVGACTRRSGMFSSSSWSWHSLIVGVDAELVPARIESSPVGLMLTYDIRRQSKGFLSEITEFFPFGAGLSAGPYWAAGEWGVGGALFLRAIVDMRLGLDYDPRRGIAPSFHVGIIDPHLLVLNFLD